MYNKGPKTLTAGANVKGKRLVKLSSGEVVHNTSTHSDDPIGITLFEADTGEAVAVELLAEGKTLEMTAAGSFAVNDLVYAADNGKVQPLPTSAGDYKQVGYALQTASGDGSIVEILPYNFHNVETVS